MTLIAVLLGIIILILLIAHNMLGAAVVICLWLLAAAVVIALVGAGAYFLFSTGYFLVNADSDTIELVLTLIGVIVFVVICGYLIGIGDKAEIAQKKKDLGYKDTAGDDEPDEFVEPLTKHSPAPEIDTEVLKKKPDKPTGFY